jgi:hypothetical protein
MKKKIKMKSDKLSIGIHRDGSGKARFNVKEGSSAAKSSPKSNITKFRSGATDDEKLEIFRGQIASLKKAMSKEQDGFSLWMSQRITEIQGAMSDVLKNQHGL